MCRLILRRTLIGWLLLAFASPLAAGLNRWTSNGPEGANIMALLVPPAGGGPMYAMTAAGTLFRSTAGAEPSWVPMGSIPLEEGRVVLASNPENANLLYAAMSSGTMLRLLRSADQGQTWNESRHSVAGAPTSMTFVSKQVGFLATLGGLFVTRDGGETWSLSRPGSHSEVVSRNGVVYTLTFGALSVSSNLGETWTVVRVPVSGVAVNPSDQTIFVFSGKRVERSSDGGSTWKVLPALPATVSAVAALAATGDLDLPIGGPSDWVLAMTPEGIYQYNETAGQWSRIASPVSSGAVRLAGDAVGQFFAATEAGVFLMSRSGEDVWRNVSGGMREASARSMALDGDGVAYVATAGGLFKSEDDGESWGAVEGITDPRSVAAGAGSTYVASSSGIHRSSDHGATWTVVRPNEAWWVGAASTSPATLYAHFAAGLERSRDGGSTWAGTSAWYVDWAAVDPTDSERVYIQAFDYWGGGVAFLRSHNGGDSFTTVFGHDAASYGLTAGAVRGSILQLAVACSAYSEDYSCGVTTSLDGGASWSAPKLSAEVIRSLALDPVRPWRSYAGTASGRVYRSDDFGNEWEPFGEGLSGGSVRHLAISDDGDRIYAGTAGGVYVYQIGASAEVVRLTDDPARLPRLVNELLQADGGGTLTGAASGLLLPAAGTVRGAGGRVFHSDVTLVNNRGVEQDVVIAFLPQGNTHGSAVPAFAMTLPAGSADEGGTLSLDDVADLLGIQGLGSLLVVAVDGAGNVDRAADLDGSARIRSLSQCGGGWVSQSIPGVAPQALTGGRRARLNGMRHEPSFRTNVGIVNLGASARTFTVVASGGGVREQFTITVPPFSPMQTAIPDRHYGAVSLTVISDGGADPWATYAASNDNRSGDAWAAIGRRLP